MSDEEDPTERELDLEKRIELLVEAEAARRMREQHRWEEFASKLRELLAICEVNIKR